MAGLYIRNANVDIVLLMYVCQRLVVASLSFENQFARSGAYFGGKQDAPRFLFVHANAIPIQILLQLQKKEDDADSCLLQIHAVSTKQRKSFLP